MSRLKKIEHLAELEAALRDDADVIRAGKTVRLNLDEAADAVAELRSILEEWR